MSDSSARLPFALFTFLLVPLGIGTKLYAGRGATWVVGNLGGAVYVAFWSLFVLTLRPSLSAARVAAVVLACTAGLEFLQLWQPPPLQAVRATLAGQALLGSYFSWLDFPYYVAGAVATIPLAHAARRRSAGTDGDRRPG